VNAIVEGANK